MGTRKLQLTITGVVVGVAGLLLLLLLMVARSGVYAKTFSTSTAGLSEVHAQQTVELRNGETYNLIAAPAVKTINGKKVRMLAYNGSVPGPLLKVPQGASVTVNFTNKTDTDTALHPHGVRVSNANDGVPGVTQETIKPGKSFTYKLTFPDAGVYWYHPHVREDYAQMSGSYGNFLVTPGSSDYWSPVNEERILVLSDISLKDGNIAPFQKKQVTNTLMGRFGNTTLVNGDTSYSQSVKTGEVVRYYVTNSANTRVFRLSIPGAKMKIVGGDNGRVEQEKTVDSITVGPSERSVIEVYFEKPGKYTLTHTGDKQSDLGTINVTDQEIGSMYVREFNTLRLNQDIAEQVSALQPVVTGEPSKQLNLGMSMGMGGMGSMGMSGMSMSGMSMSPSNTEGIEWEDTSGSMNAQSNKTNVQWKLTDIATKSTNDQINWQFKQGDKVKIRLVNDANSMHPMQHPIHIHGQRFLVTSINGKPNDTLGWKDSVLVPQGQTVDIVVDMANPGMWLLHCHIPEHMEAGMMLKFKVEKS